jgi:hypothetical protein
MVVENLTTVSRYIRSVYDESETRYGEVVKNCLFWTNTTNMELDDGGFQEAMFTSIIMPLLEDLRVFGNRAQIY